MDSIYSVFDSGVYGDEFFLGVNCMKKRKMVTVTASVTVETALVIPLVWSIFFFGIGVFFYAYDSGILYENMMRLGVVQQMMMDEERERIITLFPDFYLAEEEILVDCLEDEIVLEAYGEESGLYLWNRATVHFQDTLSIYNPVEQVRSRRKMQQILENGGALIEN